MPTSNKTLTFLDAGVLLAVFSAAPDVAARALTILADPTRAFAASDFLELEILPKSVYFKRTDQEQFYRAYFDSATTWVEATHALLVAAYREACASGLAAVDALHATAARTAGCAELITTEKQTKPLYRVRGIAIRCLADL